MSSHAPGVKGQEQEARACRYLQTHGLVLRERNYRCRHGEIDLIMDDGDTVVFVEVRYRANPLFAGGAETVDNRKQTKHTTTTTQNQQNQQNTTQQPTQNDVVAL